MLVSDGDGYRLDLVAHRSDAEEFAATVEEASSLLGRGEADRAISLLETGLDRWRGAAYADVPAGDRIDVERERLEELRVDARVLLADARSELHGPESAVSELEALTSEYPLRETLRAKLMTALYRSGRQSEALRVYADLSDLLGEELGLVPSKELRDLEESILLQDPALDLHRAAGLPVPTQPLIGRDAELATLEDLLVENRLVTLLGPGGSGKTRLAIEVATDLGSTHRDGVWFVRLDELRDETLLAPKIAAVLDMREDPDRDVADTLAAFIGDRTVALVLDNCEHLVEAVAALVALLLERCPNLTVLATSQQALNVRAERRLPIPPLALPGAGDASPFEDIEGVDSVRLFIERARAVDPALDVSEESVRAMANIVNALDGMPLAIELAAARMDLFTPAELAVRLRDRFGLLTGGPRDAPERQRELRSVFDWSFSLLDEQGRRCLSELSVFVGSFGLDAAAAVLDKPIDVVHQILGSFAQRSLLERDRSAPGETRFRMLESLRHFAFELLVESGREEAARIRHAGFYVARVSVFDAELAGSGQVRAFAEMVRESENIRSALGWALGSGRFDLGVPLAGRCGRFWDWRGSVAEATTWYGRIAEIEPADETSDLGLALSWYGYFLLESGDIGRARQVNGQARSIAERNQDAFSVAAAATVGSVIARHDGELELAMKLDAVARDKAEELDDPWVAAWADNHDALCLLALGEAESAAKAAQSSLAGFEQCGDRRGAGWSQTVIATVAFQAGDLTVVEATASAAAAVSRRVGDGRNAAWALEIAAEVAEAKSATERAEALRSEARALLNERGVPFSPWLR